MVARAAPGEGTELASVSLSAQQGTGAAAVKRIRRRGKIRTDELSLFGTFILILFAIFMVLPFVVLFGRAFMTYSELFHYPPIIIPYQLTTENFSQLVLALSGLSVPFARYLFNSLLIAVAVVFGVVMISTIAAYPLSKHKDMPGHGVMWFAIIASLMYSGPATTIPRYLVIQGLGLINTYWALILPVVVSSFGLFLMKQYIDSIPQDIIEAARVDGANEWQILKSLIYPATQPAWATLVLLTFNMVWNDATTPQLYIHTDALKTLPVAFATLGAAGVPGQTGVAMAGAQAAAAMVMALPPMIVFLATQSRVIKTMAYAGLTG
jgi:ABC-type glycerol-3-phosphate transport system permease component